MSFSSVIRFPNRSDEPQAGDGDVGDSTETVIHESVHILEAHCYGFMGHERFGNSKPPRGFVVALLGEDRSEFLALKDGDEDWLEFGDYTYRKCN